MLGDLTSQVRWYHIFFGPFVGRLVPAPADAGQIGAKSAVPDCAPQLALLADHADRIVRGEDQAGAPAPSPSAEERSISDDDDEKKVGVNDDITVAPSAAKANLAALDDDPGKISGPWILPKNLVCRRSLDDANSCSTRSFATAFRPSSLTACVVDRRNAC